MVGGVWLWFNRFQDGDRAGASTAFDSFFLYVVLAVIVTGCFVETARFVLAPQIASWLYVLHLGVVLCLFVTFPYSKFAHLLYRTLAMVHETHVNSLRNNELSREFINAQRGSRLRSRSS